MTRPLSFWLRRSGHAATTPDQVDDPPSAAVALWVSSGLLDLEYYSAVRGQGFLDATSAARDLVRHGMPRRLSPHPRVDFVSLPPEVRTHWRERRVARVLEFLRDEGLGECYGPLAKISDPAQARDHMIEAARRWHQDRRDTEGAVSLSHEAVVAAESEHLDWTRLESGLAERVPGRTSVVVPTYADARMTVRAVGEVRRRAEEAGDDVEVVVVDNGCALPLALALAATCFADPGSTLVRLPRNLGFAAGSNVGAAHTTGDTVVFLNNDTEVRRGWLAPLRAGLADPDVAGVQSLLLFGDDTIQSAGTVFVAADLLPCHFLAGHPKEDALGVAGERFDAVTAAALALRVDDVVAMRGFDTAYRNGFEDVDLCLRLCERRPGGFRVAPESMVTHLESRTPGRFDHVVANRRLFTERWDGRLPEPDPDLFRRAGFVLAEVGSDEEDVPSHPAAKPRVGDRVRRGPDHLRWSIKLPSTAGHWGDDWGDTHFADALARGLRSLGQDVVTCRRGAHDTGPAHLDDVSLVLRGRYPAAPVPGKINVLWVISHPDTVEPAELEGYDLVFAASHPWSALMSERSGREVLPLLQATELKPPPEFTLRKPGAVFVGNRYEDRERPIVGWALEAGLPLAVYGRGWEGLLPEGVWRGEYLDPRLLPEVYASYEVVLADHWPDMARHGFIANRVFDGLAAGALVVSDEVAGQKGGLGPLVVSVASPGELGRCYREYLAVRGRHDDVNLRVKRGASGNYSFRDRAFYLLQSVISRRWSEGPS